MALSNNMKKINTIYFIYFAAMACYFPFFPVFLISRNVRFTQIGIIMSLNSLVGVVFQPLWGFLSDKYFNKKVVVTVGMMGTGIIAILYTFAGSFYLLIPVVIVFSVFYSAIGPILDAYCYDLIEEEKGLQYGRVRFIGTVGYAIVSICLGYAVRFMGVNFVFYSYSLLNVIGAYVLISMNYKGRTVRQKISKVDIVELLKNKNYIIFLLTVGLLHSCINSNGSYIAELMEKTGGAETHIGILWFVISLSELPVLFIGARLLKRFGESKVFTSSLFLYSIRFLINSYCTSYVTVILVQTLQGLTFAVYIIAALEFINRISPSKMLSSAITIFSAAGGLGGFLGIVSGGFILDHISIFSYYRILAFVALIAAVISLFKKEAVQIADKADKIVSLVEN